MASLRIVLVVLALAAPAQARPVVYIDIRPGEAWTVVGREGRLWKERTVSTPSRAVMGSGLALFAISYAGAIVGGGVAERESAYLGLASLPVFGAWANAGIMVEQHDWCSGNSYARCDPDYRVKSALWAIGGVVQLAGLITFLVGTAAGPKRVERLPLIMLPTVVGDGGGLGAAGRF